MNRSSDTALWPDAREWLAGFGVVPLDEAIYVEALTHGSFGATRDYERLEFLGDRVLGLTIAEWLYQRNSGAEGTLSQRLNALVSRQTCALVARQIGLPDHIRLGKQARDDGGAESDNILGDVVESLLGASFIERGFGPTRDLIRDIWEPVMESDAGVSKHPKSALQEWAAGNQRKPPEYSVVTRSGPDHAARFTVSVAVKNVGKAEATAASKREAETAAAKAFMEKYA